MANEMSKYWLLVRAMKMRQDCNVQPYFFLGGWPCQGLREAASGKGRGLSGHCPGIWSDRATSVCKSAGVSTAKERGPRQTAPFHFHLGTNQVT